MTQNPQNPQDIRDNILETSKIVENTLKSVASQIGDIFADALSEADGIVKVFGKDVERQLKSMARSTDKMIENQLRINKGQLASKDITKQMLDYKTKMEVLEKRISHLNSMQYSLTQEQANELARLTTQLNDVRFANEDYLDSLRESLNIVREQENKIGNLGKVVKGLGKIPILGQFVQSDKILASMQENAASIGSTKLSVFGAGVKSLGSSIKANLLDPVFLFLFFAGKALKANAEAVELGKALGIQGERYRETLANIELSSDNINVTTENLTKAFSQLSASTGLAYKYSADQLITQIKLTEQVGLQAEDAAQINKFAIVNNKTSEETYNTFIKGLTTARNQLKVGINFKTALIEAAKVSGELAVNLGYNPETIAKAVVQMKALGTSLAQTKAQGDFLLNWESSIESELKSELLVGQQMNLERARAAALTGDQITLAKELANQGMTLQKFEKLNVIARRSYAEALGLNVDQLSEQLQLQKQALDSGKSFAQVTEEEAKKALERQNAQDKFNKGIEKLTSLIGNLLAGPVGMLLDMLSDAVNLLSKITSAIDGIAGSWVTKGLLGAATGAMIGGGPWGAAIGALGGIASAAMGDDVISPGYGQRMILHPEGAVALNNNDTIVAGTDLNKNQTITGNNIDLSPMIAAINSVKASVDKLYSKDINLYMDGKQIGTTLTQGSYKVA